VHPDGSLGCLDGQLFSCPKSNSEKFLNFGRAVRMLDVSIRTILMAVRTINLHYFLLAFQ
jgi:hypothetical protein